MNKTHPAEQRNYTTSLIHWGQEDCLPGHEFGGMRDYYLLHIICRGEGVYQSRGKRWKLTRGDAFLIFPGQKHSYQAEIRNPWSYFWLGFAGEFADLFAPLHISESSPVLHTDDPEELLKIYSEIPGQTIYQHPGIRLENLGRLNSILGKLCKKKIQPKGSASSPEKEGSHHVHTMTQFMMNYYNTPIQVSDVIDFVQLERSYASRIFKETRGTSLGRTLKNLRLSKAKEYLREGWSAKETAYSCGYRDYNNFLKAFKKYYGMTPGEFKA